MVRALVATDTRRLVISGTGAWQLAADGGRSTLLRAAPGDAWSTVMDGAFLRAIRADGTRTAARPGPLILRPLTAGSFVTIGGRRYRGHVTIFAADGALHAVNRLPVEDYLRGVVPLEMGKRAPGDEAALEAQAVAARSYAYTHTAADSRHRWDIRANELDQEYGGADAETAMADAAVTRTRALVLVYAGRVVSAPYHADCGGMTAAPDEVWREPGGIPYLQRVSDRIPGTDRYYCDIYPRFHWTRTFDRAALDATLQRYLRTMVAVPTGGVGTPRYIEIGALSRSGRVHVLVIATDHARYELRGNDMRFVLRTSGGEILPSTYFSVTSARDDAGNLSRFVLSGTGNGHGVGMCQWGAIGRARAGQDYRTILETYYPGTTVATVE
jgi:stage II sporulation protein D